MENRKNAGTQTRNVRLDNFKALLVIFVVLGHVYNEYVFPTSWEQQMFFYSFHMPAFVFASGLCFKPARDNKPFKNILYPYLVFQGFFLIQEMIQSGQFRPEIRFAHPAWSTWYFLSLFFWVLLVNALSFDKRSGMGILVASFAVAMIAGYDDHLGANMSMSRTVVYFPFYFLGVYLKRYYANWIESDAPRSKARIIGALCIIAAVGLVIFAIKDEIYFRWFYNSSGYRDMNEPWRYRALNLALALAMIYALWQVVPSKKIGGGVTRIGEKSVYAYVLHVLLLRLIDTPKYLSLLPLPVLTVPLLAYLVTAALTSKLSVFLFTPLVRWPFGGHKREVKKES